MCIRDRLSVLPIVALVGASNLSTAIIILGIAVIVVFTARYTKLESLVIADQNAAVNTFPGLVHTSRHTMGVSNARSPVSYTHLDVYKRQKQKLAPAVVKKTVL